jgi:putative transposase
MGWNQGGRSMQYYRRGSHTVYDLKCHVVWCTKYRKPVLNGEVGLRVRELIREICLAQEATILKGHVSKDHVHLFVSYPPTLAVSRLVQRIKGKTSYKLLREFRSLRKTYWGNHLWARGFFVCSSGNITDEVIMEYIAAQDAKEDGDFRVHDDS